MLTPEDIQNVRRLPLFEEVSDDSLDCLNLGEIVELPAGAVLAREGETHGYFYVSLAGEVRVWRTFDNQEVLMAVSKPGSFMGEMSILVDGAWMATVRVTKDARLFRLDTSGFWAMMSACSTVSRKIMRAVAERFRAVEGYTQQREKLVSLGTMAAGLAHELNNPASAASRAAADIRRASERAQCCLCPLGHELDTEAWTHLLAAEEDSKAQLEHAKPLDSLTRSDKEDEIAAWLDSRNIPESWKLSASLVDAGLDAAWLDNLIQPLPPASHAAAIGWIEARLNLEILLRQIENSTTRVSELVKAVKSYSHMDKAAMDEVDIHEGLESTLTMLGHKLKGVTVLREYDLAIPRFRANGGELNQVWTNLIDNAIHAVKGTGKIQVRTIAECDHALVEIVDNGSGIPPEAQAHMFEPFFTTKSVGTGTGLGLVISNRIVADRHGGEIEFESKPGETRFKVRLPLRRDPAAKK